jgi:hypothetical protein
MSPKELQLEVKARLKRLSPEDLRIANAFLAFLEASETKDSLPDETRAIVASFKRSWEQSQTQRVKPIERLRWQTP